MSVPEFLNSVVSPSNFARSVTEEIVESTRGYARGPERSLLGALLFDGIQAYIAYAVASTPTEKARYAEAFTWVMDTSAEEPFSFNGVCDALGISPEYLRLGLMNASTSLLHEIGKARRNF
ncbi:MAG: hypothetical protein RL518_360 [Pseudomonadota bacterium]|jgi:hypothetical protein